MGTKELLVSREAAKRHLCRVSIGELRVMCHSKQQKKRLLALSIMRKQIAEAHAPNGYFELARMMIHDSCNNCRWQAFIVCGEFLEKRSDDIWSIVRRCGQSPDDDMRTVTATVLLEHLLERYGRRFLSIAERLAKASPNFADTLNQCWFAGGKKGTRTDSEKAR